VGDQSVLLDPCSAVGELVQRVSGQGASVGGDRAIAAEATVLPHALHVLGIGGVAQTRHVVGYSLTLVDPAVATPVTVWNVLDHRHAARRVAHHEVHDLEHPAHQPHRLLTLQRLFDRGARVEQVLGQLEGHDPRAVVRSRVLGPARQVL
jgi:hypothetical protein